MKRLFVISLLLFSSSAVAERSVSRDDYLSSMDVPLKLKACEPSSYYRQCFEVTASQCEKTYMSAIRLCADKQRTDAPEIIPSREEAGHIGAKVLMCADRSFQVVYGQKKSALAHCKNTSTWNDYIKKNAQLEKFNSENKGLNQEWLHSCVFNQGEHYSKVKEFYGLENHPSLKKDSSSGHKYFYHLEEYGLWFFFGDDGSLKLIRFNPPFKGKIGGLSIGDSKLQVESLKGEHGNAFKGMPDLESKHMKIHQVVSAMKGATDPESMAKRHEMIAKISAGLNPAVVYTTAWAYGGGAKPWIRYDISNITDKVQYIFSNNCQ